MKAYIHYMWGDFPVYEVDSINDCKDGVDKFAYELFMGSGGQEIKMGQVLVSQYK